MYCICYYTLVTCTLLEPNKYDKISTKVENKEYVKLYVFIIISCIYFNFNLQPCNNLIQNNSL